MKAAKLYPRTRLHLAVLILSLGAVGCDVSRNQGAAKVQDGDPIVVDFPIAYVYRPTPTDEDGNASTFNVLDPAAFHPGAQLIIKERASADAREHVLTEEIFPANEDGTVPAYDVKDLSVSADGRKLLFSLRKPEIEGADDDEQPTWNIWLYDSDADNEEDRLKRLIISDTEAERGDDVDPHFLPDGRIVFSSNRQTNTRAILTDELKPQYSGLDDKRDEKAFVLHVWSKDGGENDKQIDQITYNVSQDVHPTVLDNGDLLFLRRDGIGRHNRLSLYTAKLDGSDTQPYYGYHSQETGTDDTRAAFSDPRVLPDGRILVTLQPREASRLGGDIVAIDGSNYIDVNQTTSGNSDDGANGQESLSGGTVDTSGTTASPAGSYSSAYPLYDGTGRLLVSWSPCRLLDSDTAESRPCTKAFLDANLEQAPPLYGLWIYNPDSGTQLPIKIPEEGFMFADAVVMAPTLQPTNWVPEEPDPTLKQENVGLVHIRSVYDIDGIDMAPGGLSAVSDPAQTPTDERRIRFLRIVKNVPIPDEDVLDFDNSIFGASTAQGMRDIVGYVPVEPDGSALFKVPADIPFTFDLVDAEGKRVGVRHENWLYVRTGEQRECTGCHTRNSTLPHGRRNAETESINSGAIGGTAFANTRLLDTFGTPHPAPEFGETMAAYYARVNGPRTPVVDIVFTDEWTDPARAVPGVDISLRYLAIATTANANPRDNRCLPLDTQPDTWSIPAKKNECVVTGGWKSDCRITINYLDSIAPLWQADRRTCDELGNVTADNTCTSCHTRTRDNLLQVPAGQLELTSEVSLDRNDFITSYAELMFDDNQQALAEGSLVDVVILEDTGEVETDTDGQPILDANGQPIPIIASNPINVESTMSTDGASDSSAFFEQFRPGGSHAGMLSAAEQKLIAEWLDIGGQYYNDPFDAPAE